MQIHSLIVANSLITRYSLQKLPAAYCKFHSLLVESLLVTCYSLLKLLLAINRSLFVAKSYSLLVEEIACCEKLLVTCCRNCLLLVSGTAPCRKITRHSLWKSPAANIVCLKPTKLSETLSFFNIRCFLKLKKLIFVPSQQSTVKPVLAEHCLTRQYANKPKLSSSFHQVKEVRSYRISYLPIYVWQLINTKLKFFQVILSNLKTYLKRRLFIKTICMWQKIRQLIVLSYENKQNRMLCPVLHF